MLEENLTEQIIGAAIDVHRYWGPGLYEEIYEKSLCRELDLREIKFQNQLSIPLIYKDFKDGDDLKVDVFIANKVVVELKAVSNLLPVHTAQLITYMKLLKAKIGLLINFNVPTLKNGLKRIVL